MPTMESSVTRALLPKARPFSPKMWLNSYLLVLNSILRSLEGSMQMILWTSVGRFKSSISLYPLFFIFRSYYSGKHPLPTTQEMTLHMDITRCSIRKSHWLYSLQLKMQNLYKVSKNKTRSWLWLRSWTPYCQIQTKIEESRENH